MTQQDLADASGVSYGMVRAIERGGRVPSDSVLDALAAALGIDPAQLTTGRRRAGRLQAALPVGRLVGNTRCRVGLFIVLGAEVLHDLCEHPPARRGSGTLLDGHGQGTVVQCRHDAAAPFVHPHELAARRQPQLFCPGRLWTVT
jgi:hypothetical protein